MNIEIYVKRALEKTAGNVSMAVGVLALRDWVGKFFLTNKSGNAVISPLGFFPRGFFDYKSVYLIVSKSLPIRVVPR